MNIASRMQKAWKGRFANEIKTVLIMVGVLGLVHVSAQVRFLHVENPRPVFLIITTFLAFRYGLVAGFLGACMTTLYSLFFYFVADRMFVYTHDAALEIVITGISTITIAGMTGWLRREYEAVILRETRQKLLRMEEQQVSLFANAIPHLVWTINKEGQADFFNEQWNSYTGVPEGSGGADEFRGHIHQDDLERVRGLWKQASAAVSPLEIDYRIRGKDGLYRWFLARIFPVKDVKGKVLKWMATATDIHEKIILEEEIKKSKEQLEIILNGVADAITVQDQTGKVVYANDLAARTLGFEDAPSFLRAPISETMGRFEIFDENGKPFGLDQLPGRKALAGQTPDDVMVEFKIKSTGQRRWSMIKSQPIFDKHGKPLLAVNIFRDMTSLKEQEREAKRAADRSFYLAKAGEILTSSLHYEETLKRVVQLAVPRLADWAAVDMLSEDGMQIRRLAVVHQDPEKVKWAYEIQEKYPPKMDAPGGLPKVLRTGNPEFYPQVTKEMIDAANPSPEQREIIEKVGFTGLMIVPFKILEKTVGAITFVTAESGTVYTQEDLLLAEELARRASLAIHNAQLFTATRQSAKKFKNQVALFDTIFDNAPIGFLFVNSNHEYVLVNRHAERMASLERGKLTGKSILDSYPQFLGDPLPIFRQISESGSPVLDLEVTAKDGREPSRHWRNSYYPVVSPEGEFMGIGIIVQEVTDQKSAEKEIHYRAHFDPLTGLPNRKSFEGHLSSLLPVAEREKRKFAVLFIDLDRMKTINDSLGHDAGDAVLKEAAERFSHAARSQDMVARWGGDEFVVLLPEVYGVNEAQRVAEKLLHSMDQSFRFGEQLLHITASVGIALFPADGQTLLSLQKNADTALYRAKASGKNRYELYHHGSGEKARQDLAMENDMRRALKHEDFSLYFQPILDLKSNKIIAAETLIRWDHSTQGMLTPEKFIPLAEELGLIVPLGTWIFRRAAEICKQWNKDGLEISVSVNVSPRQFMEHDMLESLLSIIDETGVDPFHLEIELTESVALENIDSTRHKLKELNKKGVSIVIDDFGTGYSSLNYLKRFPVSKLKIDKSFVRHMITDEQDTNIIKAIISMAQSLHLKVVAEGVDTETQLGLLRRLGCNEAQGFYISRPLSRHELFAWVKERQMTKMNKN